MERLTTKLDNGMNSLVECDTNTCDDVCKLNGTGDCKNCEIQKAFDKLAAYEDAEEAGLLIKFPVANGQEVLVVTINGNEPAVVEGLAVNTRNRFMVRFNDGTCRLYDERDIGHKVFIKPREEAEKALEANT